jgi:hypothetical protein
VDLAEALSRLVPRRRAACAITSLPISIALLRTAECEAATGVMLRSELIDAAAELSDRRRLCPLENEESPSFPAENAGGQERTDSGQARQIELRTGCPPERGSDSAARGIRERHS